MKKPHAADQPSSCATTTEPVLQSSGDTTAEPVHPGACALRQEKPAQGEAHAPQLESCPRSLQLEKKPVQQQRPSTVENKSISEIILKKKE